MTYTVQPLKPNLHYIRWHGTPQVGDDMEAKYMAAIHDILDEANSAVYFISDLRQGKIRNAMVLRELGTVTAHENFGGSTAFTGDPVAELMVSVFRRYAREMRREQDNLTWETPEEAIAYLEKLCPGITEDVDWKGLLR